MTVSRRRFLTGTGSAAALAGIAACKPPVPGPPPPKPPPPPPPKVLPGAEILVLVTLHGGNDGLNTVVPHGNPAYHSARGSLALSPAGGVHDLGSGIGLHPSLEGLAQHWSDDDLAIIQGCGYPNPDRSHFRSQDVWASGVAESVEHSGWIGRWMDQGPDDPLTAIVIGNSLPMVLRGNEQTGIAVPNGGFSIPGNQVFRNGYGWLAQPEPSEGLWASAITRSKEHLIRAEEEINTALDGADVDGVNNTTNHFVAAEGVTAPTGLPNSLDGVGGQLAPQLSVVSRLVRAGLRTRVYSVGMGGFDTHTNQLTTQAGLLRQLDQALHGFHAELDGHSRGKHVVTVVQSEFGRRFRSNQGGGTDHGTAAPVLAVGNPVNGGFYGDHPSLTNLDTNGDLKATTDFRRVYATILERSLENEASSVLGGEYAPLDFLAA